MLSSNNGEGSSKQNAYAILGGNDFNHDLLPSTSRSIHESLNFDVSGVENLFDHSGFVDDGLSDFSSLAPGSSLSQISMESTDSHKLPKIPRRI